MAKLSGAFVAGGELGIRVGSVDGREWIIADTKAKAAKNKKSWAGHGAFWGTAVGDGQAVVIGPFGNSGSILSSTENGLDWTEVDLLEDKDEDCRLLDIAHGNGRYVAVGGTTPNYIQGMWRWSDDGKTWSPPQIAHRRKIDGAGGFLRVAFGNDRFVAIGKTGKMGVSKDGESWEFRNTKKQKVDPLIDTFIEIVHGNGLFIGTGLHGMRRYSEDGVKWSEPVIGKEGEHLNAMIWTGEQFVGVAPGATYFSNDGKEWNRVPNENAPLFIAYGNGLYAGVRYRGEILTSRDAISWEHVADVEKDLRTIDFLPA